MAFLWTVLWQIGQSARLASLSDAGPDALVFIEGKKHAQDLGGLKAAGVLCTDEVKVEHSQNVAIIVTRHPQQDFAAIGRALYPNAVNAHLWSGQTGISNHAIVHRVRRDRKWRYD